MDRTQLKQLVKNLPETPRLALTLLYAEEMNCAEIAAALGLEHEAVQRLIAETLAELRAAAQ